jgi:hypothetical protein
MSKYYFIDVQTGEVLLETCCHNYGEAISDFESEYRQSVAYLETLGQIRIVCV